MCTLEPAIGFLEYRPCPLTWRIRYTSHSHGYLPERNWSQEQRSASSKAQQGGRTIGKETIRLEERIGKIGINSMPKCKCVRMQEDSWTIGSIHRTTIAIFPPTPCGIYTVHLLLCIPMNSSKSSNSPSLWPGRLSNCHWSLSGCIGNPSWWLLICGSVPNRLT